MCYPILMETKVKSRKYSPPSLYVESVDRWFQHFVYYVDYTSGKYRIRFYLDKNKKVAGIAYFYNYEKLYP